jgi:hypothetical protein
MGRIIPQSESELSDIFIIATTVKLGDKEQVDKEQLGVKELFTDYLHIINLLLEKEVLPILEMLKLVVSELEIVKIIKKRGTLEIFWTNFGILQ